MGGKPEIIGNVRIKVADGKTGGRRKLFEVPLASFVDGAGRAVPPAVQGEDQIFFFQVSGQPVIRRRGVAQVVIGAMKSRGVKAQFPERFFIFMAVFQAVVSGVYRWISAQGPVCLETGFSEAIGPGSLFYGPFKIVVITRVESFFVPRGIMDIGEGHVVDRIRRYHYELFPLVYPEIETFSLTHALNNGLLPRHYRHTSPQRLIQPTLEITSKRKLQPRP